MTSAGGIARLGVVGFNHRQIPARLRGLLAFNEAWCERLAEQLRTSGLATGIAFVSTCNRNEVVLEADHPGFAIELVRAQLQDLVSAGTEERPLPEPYRYLGEDAARHVLRVSSSLDSLVVGEREIAQQVRRSFDKARKRGWLDKVLNGLAHIASETSRRVHQETSIGGRGVGVFSLARAVVLHECEALESPRVAVLGLGEIGLKSARALVREPKVRLVLGSRRHRQPSELGALSHVPFHGFDALPWIFRESDAIIVATGASGTVIDAAALRAARGEDARPLILVDLGIPPQIAPDVTEVPGVKLFNLDWFTRTGFGQEPKQRAAIEEANALIECGVRRVAEWSGVRRFSGIFDSCAALTERYKETALPAMLTDELSALAPEQKRRVQASVHKLFTTYAEDLYEVLSKELNQHVERDEARHRHPRQ